MVSISALQKKLIVASHGQLSMTSTVLIHSKSIKIKLTLVSRSRFLCLQLFTKISTLQLIFHSMKGNIQS